MAPIAFLQADGTAIDKCQSILTFINVNAHLHSFRI